jgi:ubiquinone/menaquinone biosynthesis C-methylase UbiE
MSQTPPSGPAPVATDTYVLDVPSERDRLYLLFDAWREDFEKVFEHAVSLGGLSTDPATATWRMVDVACGEGLVSASILERYPRVRVVAYDRDPESIAVAGSAFGQRGDVHFYHRDVHEPLPAEFEPGVGATAGERFDLGLLRFALANFMNGPTALANVARLIKPGGVVLLFDAQLDTFDVPHPELQRLWDAARRAWHRFGTVDAGNRHVPLLEAAGFEVIEHVRRTYRVGRDNPDELRTRGVMVETLRSLGRLTVDLAHEMPRDEFDALHRRVSDDMDHLVGEAHFGQTVARRRG